MSKKMLTFFFTNRFNYLLDNYISDMATIVSINYFKAVYTVKYIQIIALNTVKYIQIIAFYMIKGKWKPP